MTKSKKPSSDQDFLILALAEAAKAAGKDEVPVGAIVVKGGEVIARAHNLRERTQSAIAHAEILAMQKAHKKIGSWRLEDCVLYVTLEPCPMCAGALQQARIKRVVYGARDTKAGVESLGISIHNNPKLNHRYSLECLENKECGAVLTEFFRKKRGL